MDTPGVTEFALRRAESSDAAALGELHVASWREAYADLLPPAILAEQSVDARVAFWARVIDGQLATRRTGVFVAQRGGGIVGFGSCGAQRDQDLMRAGFQAEISAIYVLEAAQGIGIGAALMRVMAADLSDRGFETAALWVLRDNRKARRFYSWLGGIEVGSKQDVRDRYLVEEVAYGWRDIAVLTAACASPPCRTRSPSKAR